MLQSTCVILVSDKQNGVFALIQKVDTAPSLVLCYTSTVLVGWFKSLIIIRIINNRLELLIILEYTYSLIFILLYGIIYNMNK